MPTEIELRKRRKNGTQAQFSSYRPAETNKPPRTLGGGRMHSRGNVISSRLGTKEERRSNRRAPEENKAKRGAPTEAEPAPAQNCFVAPRPFFAERGSGGANPIPINRGALYPGTPLFVSSKTRPDEVEERESLPMPPGHRKKSSLQMRQSFLPQIPGKAPTGGNGRQSTPQTSLEF